MTQAVDWGRTVKGAVIAAVLTVVILLPVIGMPLKREGANLIVDYQLWKVGVGALAVFVFQMVSPFFARLPSVTKLTLAVVGVLALILVVHPFFSDRGSLSSFWSVAWRICVVVGSGVALPLLIQLNDRLFAKGVTKTDKRRRSVLANPWVISAIICAAVVWPFLTAYGGSFFGGRGALQVSTLVLIYIILGLGLNIVVGFAGLLDMGYVGFYAVGAYTYALLFQFADFGFWQALPFAGLFAAIFGFLLGFPVLRLRGDYLAIVTLGFGEIIRLLLLNLNKWTGGPDGIPSIPKPTILGHEMARRASDTGETFNQWMSSTFGIDWHFSTVDVMVREGGVTFHQWISSALGIDWSFNTVDVMVFMYLLGLVMALVTLWVSNRLIRMPIGRAWEALREDEIACRSLGLNPTHIKLSAFTLGAMFAGFAGALFAAVQGNVTPKSFEFMESALILAIVVLGGMGSQLGVILAAIIITALPEVARDFAEYRMLMFGLVMVLMMRWRPQGLLPMKRPQVELKV